MSTHNTYQIEEISFLEWYAIYNQYLKENQK